MTLTRIYGRTWMHSSARERLEEPRALFNDALAAPFSLIFGNYEMRAGELVDIVVYCGLAHSNSKKAKIFEACEKSGIIGFVWAAFFAVMRDLMRTPQMSSHAQRIGARLLPILQPSNTIKT